MNAHDAVAAGSLSRLRHLQPGQQIADTLEGVTHSDLSLFWLTDLLEVRHEFRTDVVGRCELLSDLPESLLHQPLTQVRRDLLGECFQATLSRVK